MKLFGEAIAVHAAIENLNGISGHADRDMLLGWLGAMGKAPRRVFVNHGEDGVCDGFVQQIEAKLGYPAVAPFSGDEYDLTANECTAKGVVLRVRPKTAGGQKNNALFDRLMSAGQRLLAVIRKNKGLSNKNLEKFTEQVNRLCDQYDRS